MRPQVKLAADTATIKPVENVRPASGAGVAAPEIAALQALLRFELDARKISTLSALQLFAANDARRLTNARQIFVLEAISSGGVSVAAVSSLSSIDRRSPIVRDVERLVDALRRDCGLDEPRAFALPAYSEPTTTLATGYPFRELLWVPLKSETDKDISGGLLFTRDAPWRPEEISVAARMAGCIAHARQALVGARKSVGFLQPGRRWAWIAALGIALSMLIPVPMTALAPTEVVGANPYVVAAPIDGVIEEIDVQPSSTVAAGDVLVRFVDTAARNRLENAEREMRVAEAKLKQAMQSAFSDVRGRQELGVATAEVELKRAEVSYAKEALQRTVLRAPRAGLVVFASRQSLLGRPAATGERLMEIVQPSDVEARIDLSANDAVALRDKSPVRLFLDVDPLRPWSGTVTRADYRARPSEVDVLTLRTFAAVEKDDRPLPRIGLRGTAQVFGETVSLGFFLFRRPIATVRQWIGV